MNRKQEVHILEYGVILAAFLVAIYLSSSNPTGFFIAGDYAYFREVNATSMEKKISEKIKFGNYSTSSCNDGVYVEASGNRVNFTLDKEKYKNGLCTKATVKFDNIIYSKADKKKNATSITYFIRFGRLDGQPANDTDDEKYVNNPPQFLQDIQNITIEYNSSFSFNLSSYFLDNETLSFSIDGNENLSASFSGTLLELKPLSYPYNSTHQINASDGNYTTSSNLFGVYAKPAPLINATNITKNVEINITLIYPKNNSVVLEGNYTFGFSAGNASCVIHIRNSTYSERLIRLDRGFYSWGVSCNHMNQTFISDKNYFVVMASTGLSFSYKETQDLKNATNITVEKTSVGKLVFDEPIDLTVVQEMEKYINISQNRVEIDTVSMQHLNRSAILTLYGVTAKNPVIKQNGMECPSDVCQLISYENGVLVFRVKHFTVYEIEDAPVQEPQPSPSPQPSYGGGSGNFVPSPSDYSGPVIITKKNQTNKTQPVIVKNETPAAEIKTEPSIAEQKTETKTEEPPIPAVNTENYMTGSIIIRMILDSAVYISIAFIALVVGLFFMRRKGINIPKREKK